MGNDPVESFSFGIGSHTESMKDYASVSSTSNCVMKVAV